MRRVVALAAAMMAATAVAGCASSSGTARYCDLVKVAEAGVDPLADPAIFDNPTVLKAALLARVDTYSQLASRAPSAVRADAVKVRDALISINNALAKQNYQSSAANSDPAVTQVLADTSVTDAENRLQAFNASTCRT
jgi:hypothetical protein